MPTAGREVSGVSTGEGMYSGVSIVWARRRGDAVMGGCLEFLIAIGLAEGPAGVASSKLGVGMLGKVTFAV